MQLFQIDAFTDRLFGGNPAAIVPLETWLPDEVMQKLALENNLSETAFIVPKDKNIFHIRWFTPAIEVDLCGHATVAAAHVFFEHLDYNRSEITFDSRSGLLTVRREGDLYILNFPTDSLQNANEYNNEFSKILNVKVLETWKGKSDYMVVLENEATVRNLMPDFTSLKRVPARGLIVTAKGEQVDFVSRCFFPQSGVDEDPVTGSAHTTLTPFWAERLTKSRLSAQQISARGGELFCKYLGSRVEIGGKAVTYMIGDFLIPDAS
jgi:PhzF family phenazine biosynthesis protein